MIQIFLQSIVMLAGMVVGLLGLLVAPAVLVGVVLMVGQVVLLLHLQVKVTTGQQGLLLLAVVVEEPGLLAQINMVVTGYLQV
jgi:hypothetical protein|tara:strand:- start:49 stop:297 length:249 start_codon:yes stop_codon:yes gene_type:complete